MNWSKQYSSFLPGSADKKHIFSKSMRGLFKLRPDCWNKVSFSKHFQWVHHLTISTPKKQPHTFSGFLWRRRSVLCLFWGKLRLGLCRFFLPMPLCVLWSKLHEQHSLSFCPSHLNGLLSVTCTALSLSAWISNQLNQVVLSVEGGMYCVTFPNPT